MFIENINIFQCKISKMFENNFCLRECSVNFWNTIFTMTEQYLYSVFCTHRIQYYSICTSEQLRWYRFLPVTHCFSLLSSSLRTVCPLYTSLPQIYFFTVYCLHLLIVQYAECTVQYEQSVCHFGQIEDVHAKTPNCCCCCCCCLGRGEVVGCHHRSTGGLPATEARVRKKVQRRTK